MMVGRRRLRRRSDLVGWLTSSRTDPRVHIPSQVLDLVKIAPLQCLEQDDLQGIAPNLELPHFNPEPPLYALRFCPVPGHEDILGLANEDGNIAFQNIDKPIPRMPLAGLTAHNNAIFDFAWCPTNVARVVTVAGDQRAALWDIKEGQLTRLRELKGYTRSVKCVEWRPNSEAEFATGSRDNNILVWDTRCSSDTHPDNIVRSAHTHPERKGADSASVTGLVWLDDNSLVSVGGNDGVIKVWDMRKNYSLYRKDPIPTKEIFHPGTSFHQGYTGVLHSPQSCYIYVSCLDHTIYKYDIINAFQRPVSVYSGAEISSFFTKVSLSECGSYLASGSADNKVYLWNTSSPGGHIATLGPQEEAVTCVTWHRKENILASCTDDMRHRIWRPQRCTDRLLIRGSAEMTGKPEPEYIPAVPFPSTPSTSTLLRHQLRTPKSDRKGSVLRAKLTPSIKSFLTPKNNLTPGSENSPTGAGLSSSPQSVNKRGKKRRLPMDDLGETETQKQARLESVGRSISELLLNPRSPVKCSFSPSSYRSPAKPALQSPRLLPSPLKHPALDSPLRLRRPLESLLSPTANLPNYVRDGSSPSQHVCRHDKPERKTDWLTQLSMEKKKTEPLKPARSKTPKSKKKIGYKT